jgi:hypothetical protein
MDYSSKGKLMLRRLPVIWILLVFAASSAAADSQNMYKWTDDQGEVHYSQFPPPGRNAEKMQAPPPPAQSAESVDTDLQKRIEAMDKEKEKQLQVTKDADQRAEIQKIRKKNCETARQNLVNLDRGGNVRYMGADGKVMRLTEEERQKRIDETNKQIKENCNP